MTNLNEELEEKIKELSKRVESLESKARSKKLVILLISGDLDKAFAAFSVSIAALVMGYEVVMYCTFWGLNLLRNKTHYSGTSFLKKTAKWMMPEGPKNATLSKMHMGGMGTYFMKTLINENKTQSLPEMMALAKELGIKIYACEMMMEVMGVNREELEEGVIFGGASCYIGELSSSTSSLVI